MKCCLSFPKRIFPTKNSLFLVYSIIISSSKIYVAKNFISFFLACLIVISTLCSNSFFFKCKNKTYFKLIIFLKDYYFFLLSLLLLFSLIYLSHTSGYNKGFMDGLEIAILTALLLRCLSKKLSGFLVFFVTHLINVFVFELNMIFIIEMNICLAIYFFHLFFEKEKTRHNSITITKKTSCTKPRLFRGTQSFLNLIFACTKEEMFIINKDSKILYSREKFLVDLDRKKQSLYDILEEKKMHMYKIRKEIHNKCLSEVEILKEAIKIEKNEEYTLSFEDLIHYIFNNRQDKVFFIVESRMEEDEPIIIYIIKENDKAFFRFISKEFINLLNEKNEIIQSYSKAISFVSHEFRTPLNCIINMLQALQQNLESHLINYFIVPSLISSKFLLNLVNDLLDIAQMEAGKFKLFFVEFNLPALLDDTLQIISFQSTNRKIELELKIDDDINMIKSDPNRIRQIITNLLSIF